jgi:hypothetical protein
MSFSRMPGLSFLGMEDDAALGILRVAGEKVLTGGKQGHVRARFGQGEGGDGTGDAGANDKDVGLQAEIIHDDPLAGGGGQPVCALTSRFAACG